MPEVHYKGMNFIKFDIDKKFNLIKRIFMGGDDMKKFVAVAILVLAVMIFPVNVSAAVDYRPVSATALKDIIGNWYNTKGELVLTISNDYRLNGYQIVSVGFMGDTAAMYKIKVSDGNESGDIEVMKDGSWNSKAHEMLVVNWTSNDGYSLRRTKNQQYFESIGGIYLGMDKNQVVSLYGQPSTVENRNSRSTWKYNKEGFDVRFNYNVVTGITIYPYGNRKFDRSGLSANNAITDFGYKYNTSVTRRGNLDIGTGEVIHIDRNGVTLGIFTPGYVF